MTPQSDRGLSSVVGTITLVALVVVLATGVLAAGMAMASLGDPQPVATIEAATTTAACAGCGPDDQVVRLRHRNGDPLPMADLEFIVSVPGRESARLVDLPLSTNCIRDGHVEGPDLFDGRCGRVGGSLTSVGADSDGTWRAGETVHFRIQKRAVRLAPGDDVTVRVVHEPSDSVVVECAVRVRMRR
ncbi:type IV pilin N-terminal domain-containing protein [Salinibaculum salinum]|uniref:type IV pilin N-terminal domain-containing protein n=1 Tax=Salinibaculum salinum TaxID=3131996 RepID=UPI0030EB70FA